MIFSMKMTHQFSESHAQGSESHETLDSCTHDIHPHVGKLYNLSEKITSHEIETLFYEQ